MLYSFYVFKKESPLNLRLDKASLWEGIAALFLSQLGQLAPGLQRAVATDGFDGFPICANAGSGTLNVAFHHRYANKLYRKIHQPTAG